MTTPDLIPVPVAAALSGADWALPEQLTATIDTALAPVLPLLTDLLSRLGRTLQTGPKGDLTLVHDPDLAAEHYRLRIGDGIRIESNGPDGARHALRTVQQMAGADAYRRVPIGTAPITLPGVAIEDGPRFGHRGVLLDVARHFMPKDGVLRFIELISAHKLNVLHLHLTDDQGWRIQIRAFPRLTEVGGWRTESQVGSSRSTRYDGTPHGGFYTQDDLREIVAFATSRGVTVIPEIDLPGHSQAAMVAYPELAALPEQAATWPVWTRWGLNSHVLGTSDRVLDFYRTVLDELLEIFDSPLICLGGDEVPVDEWTQDPDSVRRAEDLGMTGVEELLPWFIGQLADHLRKHGRRATAWDEVGGSRLPTDVAIISWRGYRGGIDALRDGHDVVVGPEHEVYLDHRAAPGLDEPAPVGTVHTLEEVYRFEPVTDQVAEAAAEPGAGRVLGAQAQLWSEQLDSPRRVDYAAFPRLAAFAEVVWSPRESRDWPDFDRRLQGAHLARLDAAGVEYRPLDGPHPWQKLPNVPGWPLRFDELGRLVHAEDGAA